MRVLHIVSNLSVRSGVMSVLMNYYKNINRKNFKFDFLFFDNSEITYSDEIEKLGGKIYKLERTKNPLKLFVEINKFLKKNKDGYQIIHLHETYLIGALIRIKNNNTKIISHAHATKFSDHKFGNIRNRIFSIPNRFIPDYYFACSNKAGIALFGKNFKRKGCVVKNAIDISKFCKDDIKRNKIRNELNINDKFVVGHVGNFYLPKNHSFLIDIFFEMQKINTNTVLVLVGDGEKRKEIEEKCKKLEIQDKVIFLGSRNDVNEVINGFDCFIFPSIYEGLGIALIEAQATGIPCVFSTAVPEETNVLTNNNTILSLNDNAMLWAQAAIKSKKVDKEIALKMISEAGYDIQEEAKKFEQKYTDIQKNK